MLTFLQVINEEKQQYTRSIDTKAEAMLETQFKSSYNSHNMQHCSSIPVLQKGVMYVTL